MAGIPPHPSAAPGGVPGAYAAAGAPPAPGAAAAAAAAAAAGAMPPPGATSLAQGGAEFYLANYRLGKTLGIGSFGKVKVAEHVLTGHKVAIKILNRRKIQAMDMEEKVRREIKILRLFMHPHIIRLYEVIETPTDIYVVMEYVRGGELFDHIVERGRLPEDEARHFFQQIISGVEYCHRNMVVHRDLKPENLLLDSSMAVKIADFGLSNVMRDGHFLKTSCGSPNYAAPEVISGKLYAGPEVDVWSCGVILYALLCGSLPFDDENIPSLFKKIKGGVYSMPSHLSPGARDLIPRMLLVDPLKRITIPEIRCHPWFATRLPRYLAVMTADANAARPRVDAELVEQVVRLGFDREQLLAALRDRVQDKATVTYYLLADNRRGAGQGGGYLEGEMAEAPPSGFVVGGQHYGMSYGFGAGAAPGSNPGALQHAAARGGGGMPPGSGGGGMPGGGAPGAPPQRVVAERRWRLGVAARGHPSALMGELMRVLQASGVAWKKNGPYNLKCRTIVSLPAPARPTRMSEDGPEEEEGSSGGAAAGKGGKGGSGGGGGGAEDMQQDGAAAPPLPRATPPAGAPDLLPPISARRNDSRPGVLNGGGAGGAHGGGATVDFLVKFECQLYRLREEEYALDVQRLEGDVPLFLDVCARVFGGMRGVM